MNEPLWISVQGNIAVVTRKNVNFTSLVGLEEFGKGPLFGSKYTV